MTTLTSDSEGRLASRAWFPPGSTYSPARDAQGRIVLTKVVEAPARKITARLRTTRGRLTLDFVGKIRADDIGRAVREERDTR
jgi:hypothetical protein